MNFLDSSNDELQQQATEAREWGMDDFANALETIIELRSDLVWARNAFFAAANDRDRWLARMKDLEDRVERANRALLGRIE